MLEVNVFLHEHDKLLFNDNKLPNNWEQINTDELTELTKEKKLYDIKGLVVDENDIEEGDYVKLAEKPFNTKLKGNFYTNQGGKVYYEDLKSGTINSEDSNEGNLDGSEKDPVNKEDLINKKEEAEDLNPDDYEDFTDIENAINEADKVIKDDNASQKEIDDALKKLENAIENLETKPEIPVNKDDLINKKDEADKLNPDDYEDFINVENAIDEANKVIKDDDATQEEVDDAKKKLKDAMNELVMKPVNKGLLIAKIIEAEKLNSNHYTNWNKVNESLNKAKMIRDKNNANQIEIDLAYNELTNAIKNLVKKEFILATDADFEYVKTAHASDKKGYFKYIGTETSVEIPHIIQGEVLTHYYKMFSDTYVSKVKSTNLEITKMDHMFDSSLATSLDLSSLNTSNVTAMNSMFSYSKATSINLSNFNTAKVQYFTYMFQFSQATILDLSSFDTSTAHAMTDMFWGNNATLGYARTYSDAYKLNETLDRSNKHTPSSLIRFIEK